MYTNFIFLNERFPNLYRIICQAVDNLYLDTDTTIYKVRKFTEELVNVLLGLENIVYDDSFSLNQKISLLEANTNIDCIDCLHALRRLGNMVVHGGSVSRDVAISTIEMSYYLAQFLMSNYFDMEFITDPAEKKFILGKQKEAQICKVTKEDNTIFNEMMNELRQMILSLIIDEKLDGLGYVEEISYIGMEEFQNYFIICLKNYASINRSNMRNLLYIKNILKQRLNTNDNEYINKIICQELYKECPWSK